MQDIYYDPAAVGSFGSIRQLAKATNKTFNEARNWLIGEETYTLHKPIKRNFRRRKIFVVGINQLWQIDLCDLSLLSRYNDGNKYILTIIDCFSRYAYAVPIQNKSSITVRDAFASVIESTLEKPVYVQSDKGSEFLNAIFQKYLTDNGIIHYTSQDPTTKASLCERFNRTIKTKIYRYFTYKKTLRYVDILQDIINTYNNTVHSTIQMPPSLVNRENEHKIYEILYGYNDDDERKEKIKWKFNIDDQVRISGEKKIFQKGYQQGWSKEIFTVKKRFPTDPQTYEIHDYDGEPIKGKFYAEELQKVRKEDNLYTVEKIVGTRRRGGKLQYLVRWAGYPSKFDSYVDSVDINN